MKILKKKWFRITSSVFLALVVAVSGLWANFHLSVDSDEGLVSIGLSQVQAQELGEIVLERTATSKITYLGENKYALDVSIGAIHYDDGDSWQEIDNEFVPSVAPWDWEMIKVGYNVKVKEDITAGQTLELSKQGSLINLQPMALEWTNDYNMIQQVSMPQDVASLVTNPEVDLLPAVGMLSHQGQIAWENAYGEGIDFEWQTTSTRLLKRLVIGGLADLPPPAQYIQDGGNPVLRLNLIFAPSSDVDIYVNNSLWDKSSKQQTFDVIEFRKDGEVLWGFMPLKYWDSADNEGQSIATLEKRGNSLYISIRVPYGWLQTATYPVYIDPTIDLDVVNTGDDGANYSGAYGFTTNDAYGYSGYVNNANLYHSNAYFRFEGATITGSGTPAAVSIDAAYVTFYTSSATNPQHIIWYGVDEDNPAAPTSAAEYAADNLTTASVSDTSTYTAGATNNSTDLSAIIQELADSYVISGDAIMLQEKNDGTESAYNHNWRSRDSSIAASPNLHIESSAGGVPDVTVSPASYDFGAVVEGSTTNTTTSYFTISNNSTVQTDQTISVTTANWSGGNQWIHSDTATAGVDTAGLVSNNGTWGVGDVIIKYASPNFIYEDCPASSNYTFGLSLVAPTEFTDGVEKQIVVRIIAVAG